MASYAFSDRCQTLMHEAQEHLEQIDPSGSSYDEEYGAIVDVLYMLHLKHKPHLTPVDETALAAYHLKDIDSFFMKSIESEVNNASFIPGFKLGILHNVRFYVALNVQSLLDGPYMEMAKNIYVDNFKKKRAEFWETYRYPTEEDIDPRGYPPIEPWLSLPYKDLRVKMLIFKAFVLKCLHECEMKIKDVWDFHKHYEELYYAAFKGKFVDYKGLIYDKLYKKLYDFTNGKISEQLLILKLSQQDNDGTVQTNPCSHYHIELLKQ